jgi:hypothetical protein
LDWPVDGRVRPERTPMYLFMSRKQIRNNWDEIMNDPDNPRPDIKSPDEYIAEIERGDFKILGATVVLQDQVA